MAKAFIDKAACVGCEACVGTCPVEAIVMAESVAKIDVDVCIECGSCVFACPTSAISQGEDKILNVDRHFINPAPTSTQSSMIEEKWLKEY